MTIKMKFFNFGLEHKLDWHFCVEFHSDSDGNSFKAQQRNNRKLAPELALIDLNDP